MFSRFSVNADDIEIITDPTEFYNTLLAESKKAQKRILISSLYLGTGELEQELVKSWSERVNAGGASFRLKALFDANRGTRSGAHSSASLLLPLVRAGMGMGGAELDGTVRVSLFHSPALRNLARRIIPERFNELAGTQHMKIYAFDDTVILSGANLSHDYFTCRVDRFYVFRNVPELVDYYENLMDVMAKCSLTLTPDGDVVFHPSDAQTQSLSVHPYKGNHAAFCRYCGNLVRKFIETQSSLSKARALTSDTTVTPLLQMSSFGIKEDEEETCAFLRSVEDGAQLDVATSYFNLAASYVALLKERSTCSVNIVAAGPQSHGFHGATGMSSYVPIIYIELTKRFLQWMTQNSPECSHISFSEYSQPKWVFHAKGLWYTPTGPQGTDPTVTFIGSSNFGYRSVLRDLENQLILQTNNRDLRSRMGAERDDVFARAQKKTLSDVAGRHVPFVVRLLMPLIRRFV